jgi:hypothetical protein
MHGGYSSLRRRAAVRQRGQCGQREQYIAIISAQRKVACAAVVSAR